MTSRDKPAGDLADWLEARKRRDRVSGDPAPPPALARQTGTAGPTARRAFPEARPADHPAPGARRSHETPSPSGRPPPPELPAARRPAAPHGDDRDFAVGGGLLPAGVYALLLLTHIDSPMAVARGLPRALLITRRRTLIGRHAGAHIHLVDDASVHPKHAVLVHSGDPNRGAFSLVPIGDAPVELEGRVLTETGSIVRNGAMLRIGHAELVFFCHPEAE